VRVPEFIDELEAEGPRLAAAADAAGWDADVLSCPDWAIRDLVTHIGGVHRWATEIVVGALSSPGAAEIEVGSGPADAELLDWFVDGHQTLVDALRSAPASLEAFTFLPAPTPLTFWARRQALETAVHRIDAQTATGTVTPLEESLAVAGIEEMLTGFGRRRKEFEPGVIRLEPEGTTAWQITLSAAGAHCEANLDGTNSDVTISGTPSEVYLWLWNRPSGARIEGDPSVAERWTTVRVRWS
jgi:uncharacterized protein (TIGR03083 family)